MKAMVLGMGLQGKAVIHDLESSFLIKTVYAADLFPTQRHRIEADRYLEEKGYTKTKTMRLDVSKEKNLPAVFSKSGIDIVICMLPIELAFSVAHAALTAGVPFVSSNYTYDLQRLDEAARRQKAIILPEMGLDPGIDLILGRLATDELDAVYGLYSYGGGIPAPEAAAGSPIGYKISWIFDRVLDVYVREARLIKDGQLLIVPGQTLFRPDNVHRITFPGLGTVEAYPNGDAHRYVEIFGLGDELVEMGRFALRWPGHAQFWRTMVALGLLDDKPILVGQSGISPRAFLAKCLTPRLKYLDDERDVALLRVEAWGLKANRKVKITYDLIDYRDLETGLFAMNRTVGFSSSIGALMILNGQITQTGVLSPVRDVPAHAFVGELNARGIQIDYKIEEMN